MPSKQMTDEQDKYFQLINDFYGDCKVISGRYSEFARLDGIDEDEQVRCTFFVSPTGLVNRGLDLWDPDNLLEKVDT